MKLKERQEAIKLRKQGFSLKELSNILKVSKGSVSLWVRDLELSDKAKKLIQEKYTRGQIASQESHRKEKIKRLEISKQRAIEVLKKENDYLNRNKIICALLYWCEGVKNDSYIGFTNSDPNLIATFLRLLRESFTLDEKKFRVCVHIHEYHNMSSQIDFWSTVTSIPKDQFMKPYHKKNGGIRVRKNYEGCANIRYYNARLAQDLLAIAREYIKGPIG